MFSAVTSAHMALMSGSRACFAIARGGLFPASLARLHPRLDTPAPAIVFITLWSALLVLGNALFRIGSRPLYTVLITYVMFGLLLFGGLICAAAIRLRVRHPEWKRPYRTWGYPVTPLASILITVFLLITMLTTSPWEACSALIVILLGWPVYVRASRRL
jgi:APA family basic amino acid/polyamine antiporter